jgi:hypothetical protein
VIRCFFGELASPPRDELCLKKIHTMREIV